MDISIIIPTYNRLWSLPETIKSCLQSTCSVEIIVIDDGSTDGTWEWLEQQTNIISVRQNNWGKCWAANLGFSLATGKYIRFLDSDDLLDKNAIDEQFELAENQNADVVVSGYQVIDTEGTILRKQEWVYCDDFISQQLGECDSSHYSAYLFKKDLISDIPHRPDFAFRDDRLFVLEVVLKKPLVAIHRGTALLHRKHTHNRLQFNSGMKQTLQNFQHFNLYRKIFAILQERAEMTERRKKAAIKILWPLAHWTAKHNIPDAVEIFQFILSLDPDYTIEGKSISDWIYKLLGFKRASKVFHLVRLLKYGIS